MEHRRRHMSCTLLEYMLTRLCPRYAQHMAFSIYLSNSTADLDCHCTVVQGAHPFTTYAMTSPNGNADATVRHDKLNFIFLVLIIQESNASRLSRELLQQLVILTGSPLKAKTKVQQKDPKEV